MNRRDFFVGLTSCIVGGSVAAVTGLSGYYYLRKKRAVSRAIGSEIETGIDDWIISEKDFFELSSVDVATNYNENINILENINIPDSGDYQSLRVRDVNECLKKCTDEER